MGLNDEELKRLKDIEDKIDAILGNGIKFDDTVLTDLRKDIKTLKTKVTKIDNRLKKFEAL